jgi:hypothetical protein
LLGERDLAVVRDIRLLEKRVVGALIFRVSPQELPGQVGRGQRIDIVIGALGTPIAFV